MIVPYELSVAAAAARTNKIFCLERFGIYASSSSLKSKTNHIIMCNKHNSIAMLNGLRKFRLVLRIVRSAISVAAAAARTHPKFHVVDPTISPGTH